MTSEEMLKLGTQIIYVPTHARGDVNHRDSQVGFVTSQKDRGSVFCRYWSKYASDELRTRANSERANISNIVVKDTVEQSLVQHWIDIIDIESQLPKWEQQPT